MLQCPKSFLSRPRRNFATSPLVGPGTVPSRLPLMRCGQCSLRMDVEPFISLANTVGDVLGILEAG